MGDKLWTGESVYCRCGHHIIDHYITESMFNVMAGIEKRYGKCMRCERMLERFDWDNNQKCDGFSAYK
jgi:hypothetical protein